MKSIKTVKKDVHQYTALFEPDPAGGYTVTIPALPGCISEGDTFEESLENIRDAAELYLAVTRQQKRVPHSIRDGTVVAPVLVRG